MTTTMNVLVTGARGKVGRAAAIPEPSQNTPHTVFRNT
jgi:hypothetical protein